MSSNDTKRKIFVIDTSVLLYDKKSIHSFPGNDVIIPLIVLDELDRFKDKRDIIGENARYINRFLDDLRADGDLSKGRGIEIEGDQYLKVDITPFSEMPVGLDSQTADNKIIGHALKIAELNKNQKVIVVTKDINFRVKCDAVGMSAEDYYKDTVSKESLDEEIQEIIVPDHIIDDIYAGNRVTVEDFDECFINIHPAEPLVLKGSSNTSKSVLVVESKGFVKHCSNKPAMAAGVGIEPKNKEQVIAMHMLLDTSLALVSLTGIAGSGKTFLSLMAGLSGLYNDRYKRIVITRAIQPVGRDLGFLPGDVKDKMSVWIQPIVDNFREGTGRDDTGYFDMMQEKGQIEIAPLAYIRGRTFNDAYIIVDEAQNASIHELKTIITRVGRNSKIVLLGDIDQVDTPYLDTYSNGLSVTVDKFKQEPIAGHVKLEKGERSELATIASHIL